MPKVEKRQPVKKAAKPDCYKCICRKEILGDAHSRCGHPDAAAGTDPLMQLMVTFASVGRCAPVVGPAAVAFGIRANLFGVNNGWFQWPFNFDPRWLEACNKFQIKEEA